MKDSSKLYLVLRPCCITQLLELEVKQKTPLTPAFMQQALSAPSLAFKIVNQND